MKLRSCTPAPFLIHNHSVLYSILTACVFSPTTVATTGDDRLFNMSLSELMAVEVISVSKRPERLVESPSAIHVITSEQINRSGATSIPEALRLAPNLNVAQQNAHEWIISARGFSSDVGNKLLVMIDGRSVYTPLFSGVFWDRQDYLLKDIERIEVISGPGGALWGANAVNGVINIITKSAEKTQGTYIEGGIGTALNKFAGARYGSSIGEDTAYRVYAKYFDRDPETLSNGSSGQDDWQMGQAGFRLDSHLTTVDELTLQGDYYHNEMAAGIDEASMKGGNILGRWSRDLGNDATTSLQVYYDRTELRLPVPVTFINGIFLAPEGTFRDTLDTVDIDFQHQFQLGKRQQLVWGLAYRYTHDELENAPGLAFYPEKLEQDLYSAFFQDEIALIADELYFTIGSKVEHNDYTGTEWEPNVRLSWQISPNHTLWTAISRAVRMPSRIDRNFSQPAEEYFVILRGDENFESEKVNAYELGYRGQPTEFVTTSLSLFYNEYHDIRSTSLTEGTIFPLYFANNLEGHSHGAELSLNLQALQWWQLRFGYNYLDETLNVKDGAFDFNQTHNETADPQNQFSLHSSMDLGSSIQFDISYRWVDDVPANNAGVVIHVSDYEELNLRLGWRLTENLELSLVAQNLLHDHHQEFGFPGERQQEVGRNIYGKFALRY